MSKPATVFIDVDGVLLKHEGPPSKQWHEWTQSVHGALDLLDRLESSGAHIVLCTARPEHRRQDLVAQLEDWGAPYHQLIMGCTSGVRLLINDSKPDCGETALAYTHRRNEPIDVEAILEALQQ